MPSQCLGFGVGTLLLPVRRIGSVLTISYITWVGVSAIGGVVFSHH